MKKLISVLVYLAASSLVWGQGVTPTLNTITASGSSCTTWNNTAGACDIAQLPQGTGTYASITLAGTWVATVQFEQSADYQNTWTAVNCVPQPSGATVSSATANGTWVCPTSAMTFLRARASAYTSGIINALIQPAIAGGGTVGANSGAAGSIPTYAASGGSTLLSPDPYLSSNGAGILSVGGVGAANNGQITYFGLTSGSATIGCTTATCTQWGGNFSANFGKFVTNGNCAANGTAASPSVVACAGASSGVFSCDVAASAATCTINTTQVTANSVITVTQVASENTRLSKTCNTTLAAPIVSAKVAATSFSLTLPTFTTNPMCFSYIVMN